METQSAHKPLFCRGAWHRTLSHTHTQKNVEVRRTQSQLTDNFPNIMHPSLGCTNGMHMQCHPESAWCLETNGRISLLDSCRFELAKVLTRQKLSPKWHLPQNTSPSSPHQASR